MEAHLMHSTHACMHAPPPPPPPPLVATAARYCRRYCCHAHLLGNLVQECLLPPPAAAALCTELCCMHACCDDGVDLMSRQPALSAWRTCVRPAAPAGRRGGEERRGTVSEVIWVEGKLAAATLLNSKARSFCALLLPLPACMHAPPPPPIAAESSLQYAWGPSVLHLPGTAHPLAHKHKLQQPPWKHT